MAYEKTTWEDRIVEAPMRFTKTEDADGKITLEPAPGSVVSAGTPISADNMNKMEKGIEDAHNAIDNTNTALESTNEALTETNQNLEDHTHGHISKDGKIGSAADMFLVTGAGGTIDVLNAQAAVSALGISNPNILHNWDFRNPVNQRGVTGVITQTGSVFIDRWILQQGKVEMQPDHIIVFNEGSVGTHLEQRIEGGHLRGKEVTFTVKFKNDDTYYSKTGVVPQNPGEHVNISYLSTFSFQLGFSATGGFVYAKYIFKFDAAVEAVKLELGTVSTLHLDPPMDWAVELPKCQRFFCNGIVKFPLGYLSNSKWYYVGSYRYAMPMRVKPTLTIKSAEIGNVGVIDPTEVELLQEDITYDIGHVVVNRTGTPTSVNHLRVYYTASADI